MNFHGPNHIYECLPPFRNNRQLPPEEQIIVGVKALFTPELDAFKLESRRIQAHAASAPAADEAIAQLNLKMIASKIVFIRGVCIDGIGEVTDFGTLFREAPLTLVEWVIRAPLSTEELLRSERHNFNKPAPAADRGGEE
jgi:hypothetical protein